MENSKAISPEIKALFDTIKLQAKDYADAFDILDKEIKELKTLKDSVANLAIKLHERVESTLNESNKIFQDTFATLEPKVNKVIKVYDELDGIRELKESLITLHASLKRHSYEFNSSLEALTNRAEVEIDSTLLNLRNRIEKEVESETQKIEVKIALKLRHLEGKILGFDQKIWNMSDAQAREYKSLSDEIDSIRSKPINYKQLNDEIKKILDAGFGNNLQELISKTSDLEIRMQSALDIIDEAKKNKTTIREFINVPEVDYSNQLKKLDSHINQIKNDLALAQANEKKYFSISIIAIIIAVVAIVIAFI